LSYQAIEFKQLMNFTKWRVVQENLSLIIVWNNFWSDFTYL